MSIGDLIALICIAAPLLVASRRVTAGGKVGWFFLAIGVTILAAGTGALIVMVANGSVYDVANNHRIDQGRGDANDLGGLLGALVGGALFFLAAGQKSPAATMMYRPAQFQPPLPFAWCSVCRTPLRNTDQFCPGCSTRIDWQAPASSPPSPGSYLRS